LRCVLREDFMQITTGAKYLFKILFLLCLMFAQTAFAGEVLRELPASINPQGKYVFFLHGLVVETQGAISANTAEYGMYHYKEILDTLAGHGFIVISEERGSDTRSKPMPKKSKNR
jgi:hypothetical protein